MLRVIFGRGLVFASSSLLFFCLGCSKPTTWSYSEVESSSGFLRPACIQALSSLPYIQLELSRTEEALVGHINFLYQELAPAEGVHPDLIELGIEGEAGRETFLCTRLKGGGRLLLSKPATEFLLSTLKASEEITLSIRDESLTVDTDGFKKQLKRLENKTNHSLEPSFGLDWN